MNIPSLPEGLRKRIEDLEGSLRDEDFHILVWGSGESAEQDYEKRKRIFNYLAEPERFGPNNVFMSEDIAFRPLVERYEHGVAEALQAGAVDAVVALDTSIGPHTEIALYADILVGKTLVFVPHEHKESEGFARTAFVTLKAEGYTPEQYESCNDICRMANEFAQGLRLRKAKHGTLSNIFGG